MKVALFSVYIISCYEMILECNLRLYVTIDHGFVITLIKIWGLDPQLFLKKKKNNSLKIHGIRARLSWGIWRGLLLENDLQKGSPVCHGYKRCSWFLLVQWLIGTAMIRLQCNSENFPRLGQLRSTSGRNECWKWRHIARVVVIQRSNKRCQ
jgi:hypothetical protein